MDVIHATLKEVGLSPKEIDIYIMLLSIGSAPASVLAKRTGMTRSTAQYTCQQLVKHKIVKMVELNNTFMYAPEPPEQILDLLKKKEERVSRIIEPLRSIMHPASSLPKVKVYEGIDGYIQALESFSKQYDSSQEIVAFSRVIEEKLLDPELEKHYFDHFVRRRVEAKVHVRVIATASPGTVKLQNSAEESYREIKVLPLEEFPIPTADVLVYKNTLYLMAAEPDNVFACEIENEVITAVFRAMFEKAWKDWKGMS